MDNSDHHAHPQRIRLATGTAALMLLASMLLMAAFVLGVATLRRDELDDAREGLRRLSLTLSEHTGLALRELDLILRAARTVAETGPAAPQGEALHDRLHNLLADLPQGQALMIFGADGWMRAHSREWPTPRINVSDRDYFITQQRSADALFVSRPLRNRVNGRWMVSLSRRISGKDGAFAGVVMAAVDLDYFGGLYDSLKLPKGSLLELRRADGTLLAVSPFNEEHLGKTVPAPPPDSLSILEPVPGMPLSVRLTMPGELALQPWKRLLTATGVGMLAVVGFAIALFALRQEYVHRLRERTRLLQISEQALRESETRYRTIVETAVEGICVLDPAGRITYANHVLAGMLGLPESELIGLRVADLLFEGDEEAEAALASPDRMTREIRLRGAAGREVWALVSAAGMRDAGGAPSGSFAMLMDITSRKEEEQFRQGTESILRHDLRSPLVSMGYIPDMLLNGGGLDETQRFAANELKRYVRRMMRMVDAYIWLSRSERHAGLPDPKPFDLAAVLRDVAVELKAPLSKAGGRILASLDGAPLLDADEVTVVGEEILCHTMLTNLVKNALEASPSDSVVEVAIARGEAEVAISVANSGEVPSGIRERFFQKHVTAGKRRGTGLGAYSARIIAEAHGGSIELDASGPGRTSVRVRLPLAGPPEQDPPEQKPA
jgi:PAS domain S-box-containing protein